MLIFFVAALLSASPASAERCTDTDLSGANQGRNFEVRGMTEVRSDTNAIVQSKSDRCDGAGVNLTEYFCAGSAIASATMRCSNGCLDGACSTPGPNNSGCFTIIGLKITPPTDTAPSSLSLVSAKRAFDPLWLQIAGADPTTDGPLEVILKDGGGKAIKSLYAEVAPAVFDVPQSAKTSKFASRVVLPFDPAVRSITFKLGTSTLSYTLPTQLLQCGRPCVAVGGAGEDPNYDCCSGLKKRYINETGFVCEAAPPPTYTPNATPRAG